MTKANVGALDRGLRAILGAALLILALFFPAAAGLSGSLVWVAGVVGAVLLGTAAIRFCPLYRLLGVCT